MNTASRSYYRRFYRLVAMAVTIMMTVFTGSLVLGDSVRGSLVDRVTERIGTTETIVQTGTGFVSDKVLSDPLLDAAQGFLLVEGFVSHEGRMIPVTVWGCEADTIGEGEALVNEELNKQIGGLGTIVLHLPANGLVPTSSPFVTQSYSTQLRLHAKAVRHVQDGGNLWLRNEQVRPLNLFVNRGELASAMDLQPSCVNVILSPKTITGKEFASVWHPALSGIKIEGDTVSSDRMFLTKNVVDSLQPLSTYLAYFVNSLGSIPYAFVTATDFLHGDETVLSDIAANRMGVHVGDTLTMEYYVVKGLKRLETRRHTFRVSRVVPLSQMTDPMLTASFPGLSDVERCTDWDSDLPIDMQRITKVDEDYWDRHRQTPRALVSLDAVGADWQGDYGVATKLLVSPDRPVTLSPEAVGIAVVHPREEALSAARNGTDFASLFLALGFLIILASVLLMWNPLAEMYHLRQEEIALFGTLGFRRSAIFRRLYTEALPVILMALPVGLALGYAYAALMLWLMAKVWNGVTHTDGFSLHIHASTVVISLLVGIAIALLVLALAVRRGIRPQSQSSKHGTASWWPVTILAVVTLIAIVLNFLLFHSMVLFVVCGLLWIGCGGWIGMTYVVRQAAVATHPSPPVCHLNYFRQQHLLAFWTLTVGVFTVFAVGLNRPDADHWSEQSTGGYQWFAESHVPLLYDLNERSSRQHLSLADLPESTHFMQLAKHTEDEASCWNLNKVTTPSVLGADIAEMAAFGIDTLKLTATKDMVVAIDEEALLWSMMKKEGDTLHYTASDGRDVAVVIADTYPTGLFHGHAMMPMEMFRSLWPEETGSRVMLVRVGTQDIKQRRDGVSSAKMENLLSTALSDYGLTVVRASERLQRFFEVTDAYLSIFMSLGGLGLLLGLASMLIVIRKNLAARRAEVNLYKTMGFASGRIVEMLRREQCIVPFYAIVVGATGSIISISANVRGVPLDVWLVAFGLLLLLIVTTWIIIKYSINSKSINK